jgi:hypothetical protein
MDDPKFDGVREDARLFGAWALLLVYADMAYPAPTYRPPTISLSAFRRLVACGLVDELPGKRYKIHALASEREMRSHSARNAAASRWEMPSKAKQSRAVAEQSKEEKEKEEAMPFRREFAPSRPKPNSVDRDPHLRELRDALIAREKES